MMIRQYSYIIYQTNESFFLRRPFYFCHFIYTVSVPWKEFKANICVYSSLSLAILVVDSKRVFTTLSLSESFPSVQNLFLTPPLTLTSTPKLVLPHTCWDQFHPWSSTVNMLCVGWATYAICGPYFHTYHLFITMQQNPNVINKSCLPQSSANLRLQTIYPNPTQTIYPNPTLDLYLPHTPTLYLPFKSIQNHSLFIFIVHISTIYSTDSMHCNSWQRWMVG